MVSTHLHVDPKQPDAYWMRHQLHLLNNDASKAHNDIDKLLQYDNAHYGGHIIKARLLQLEG